MTLKRKASFTTLTSPRNSSSYYNSTSPIPCILGDVITIDETPRHLHSRTRKRLRNDRPGDQEVYDKTLGWLFSAQKQSNNNGSYASSTISPDDAMQSRNESSGNISSSLKPDPNQQTLLKFFQTGQGRPSPIHTLPSTSNLPNNVASQTSGSSSPSVWAHNSASSAFSTHCGMDMDVDMQMDVDSNVAVSSASPQEKTWVGGIGWM